MTGEALLALSVFAFATSITPGPNNMMLLASGVNFRVPPHDPAYAWGIGFGFTSMLVVVGLGLGAALTASPNILAVLQLVAAGYMLWLALAACKFGGLESWGVSARHDALRRRPAGSSSGSRPQGTGRWR